MLMPGNMLRQRFANVLLQMRIHWSCSWLVYSFFFVVASILWSIGLYNLFDFVFISFSVDPVPVLTKLGPMALFILHIGLYIRESSHPLEITTSLCNMEIIHVLTMLVGKERLSYFLNPRSPEQTSLTLVVMSRLQSWFPATFPGETPNVVTCTFFCINKTQKMTNVNLSD